MGEGGEQIVEKRAIFVLMFLILVILVILAIFLISLPFFLV